MLICMRTTIRLPDALLEKAKRRAAAEGRTFTSLVEEGLAMVLAEPPSKRRKGPPLPVSEAKGGVRSGVDLNRWAELEEAMAGR